VAGVRADGFDLSAAEAALPASANTSTGLNFGPWPVHYKYNKTGVTSDVWVEPGDLAEGYKKLGHCIPGCQDYGFDDSFWQVGRQLAGRLGLGWSHCALHSECALHYGQWDKGGTGVTHGALCRPP
jgi:hypothetical protein